MIWEGCDGDDDFHDSVGCAGSDLWFEWSGCMKFAEWSEKWDSEDFMCSEGRGVFNDCIPFAGRVELYDLSDYKVSGISGGVLWLVPVVPVKSVWECPVVRVVRKEPGMKIGRVVQVEPIVRVGPGA